jgi:hypothetical protein
MSRASFNTAYIDFSITLRYGICTCDPFFQHTQVTCPILRPARTSSLP